jgi:glycosyltransferase involved in cell wall biosynthesis
MAKISIIIPCYYNESNIPVTGRALIDNEKRFPRGTRFEYIFVDDGSGDRTFTELVKFQKHFPHKIIVVKLSRNFGSNNASVAGLHEATGDCTVLLAADLQDPPKLIPKMFAYWQKGAKLVIATRIGRQDGRIGRIFSGLFHFFMRRVIFPSAPRGGFDLCLFDKQLKSDILRLKEKNFFIPYLLIWLGYDYVTIPYIRQKRSIGHSQWTIGKRIKSFIDSFVSFTYIPLRIITVSGFILSVMASIYAIAIIHARLTSHIPVEGWTTLVIILLFVSSFQMIALGIIGEYLWRTLDAARNRPPYIIEKIIKSR